MAKAIGLAGKKVSLSPGHGKVWTGSSYAFERPVYCSPLNREDDHNLEIMTYLDQYLRQDGATTKVYRCLNKSYGTHTGSGEPWWRISAGYWLKQNGYPCSVYASSTGDCNLGTGASESSDSLRSRGLASDYDATDIYVSLHSNGYTGDCAGSSCPNGTCTYYDTSTEHATWGAISRTLATDINNSLVDSIRNKYGDTTWRDRGALDANGSQAETRIPNRAAVLIELAFHDSCDRDGAISAGQLLPLDHHVGHLQRHLRLLWRDANVGLLFGRTGQPHHPWQHDGRFNRHGADHVPQPRGVVE